MRHARCGHEQARGTAHIQSRLGLHRGARRAGMQHDDARPAAPFLAQRAREAVQPGLGCRVGRQRPRAAARDRSDQRQRAAGMEQRGREGVRDEDGGGQVHAHRPADSVGPLDPVRRQRAGARAQDRRVHAARVRARGTQGLGGAFGLALVRQDPTDARHGRTVPPSACERPHAARGQRAHDLEPDPVRRARHEEACRGTPHAKLNAASSGPIGRAAASTWRARAASRSICSISASTPSNLSSPRSRSNSVTCAASP